MELPERVLKAVAAAPADAPLLSDALAAALGAEHQAVISAVTSLAGRDVCGRAAPAPTARISTRC